MIYSVYLVAVVAIIFVILVISKSANEKERDSIGKDEIQDEKGIKNEPFTESDYGSSPRKVKGSKKG